MEIISSKENKRIKYLKKLLTSAAFRRGEKRFVCEGLRLCEDALKSGACPDSAYFSQSFIQKNPDFASSVESRGIGCFELKDSIFTSVSDTVSPQGVLFVIKILDKSPDFDKIKDNGKVLALDNVQDPSNLGTIMRTAEAFGMDTVVLSKDSCDVYSPKVIRGSMGAVFRLAVFVTESLESFIRDFNSFGTSFAAVLDRDSVTLDKCTFDKAVLTVVGNEGNGISEEVTSACTKKVFIPMSGRAESLNVSAAAAVLMWEMTKQA